MHSPSETTYSRILDRSTALPSAKREYGVLPAPFSCSSYRLPVCGLVLSKRLIARYFRLAIWVEVSSACRLTPSPSCPAHEPLYFCQFCVSTTCLFRLTIATLYCISLWDLFEDPRSSIYGEITNLRSTGPTDKFRPVSRSTKFRFRPPAL
jgi:hypothetical protein